MAAAEDEKRQESPPAMGFWAEVEDDGEADEEMISKSGKPWEAEI